jgi:hypothetical protein
MMRDTVAWVTDRMPTQCVSSMSESLPWSFIAKTETVEDIHRRPSFFVFNCLFRRVFREIRV